MDTAKELQELAEVTARRKAIFSAYDQAIEDALDDGCRKADVARAAGVSRARIDQIANPGKEFARKVAVEAKRLGKLTPQPCQHCGKAGDVDMHHSDYSDPLAVTWLCEPCHKAEHVRLRAEAKTGYATRRRRSAS